MLKIHAAPTSKSKSLLKSLDRKRGAGNVSWLDAALKDQPEDTGTTLLIGGANLTHFRLRVAQAHARRDLLPSFWSHVAILRPGTRSTLYEVSLEPQGGFHGVPRWQGIQTGNIAAYDDPASFPNIAVIQWSLKKGTINSNDSVDRILGDVLDRLCSDRGTVDLPFGLWTWLGFVWGITDQTNPLLRGIGIPSAVLVETAFATVGVELTPGIAGQASCPEAIWQAAKWWGDFYDSEATLTKGRPTGYYCVDQPAAAVTDEVEGERPRRAGRTKSRR